MALEISYARCAIITSILKKSAARLTFFVFYFLPNVGLLLLSFVPSVESSNRYVLSFGANERTKENIHP